MDESITAHSPRIAGELELRPSERRRSRGDLVEAIHQLASTHQAHELTEDCVASSHRRLHSDAVERFGSWDAALATALRVALASRRRAVTRPITPLPKSTEPAPPTRSSGLRQPHPGALRATVAITRGGYLLRVPGTALTASETRVAPGEIVPWPDSVGHPTRLLDLADTSRGIGVSSDGRMVPLDLSRVLTVNGDAPTERLGAACKVEKWVTVLDRGAVEQGHVVVVVTRRGLVRTIASTEVLSLLGTCGEMSGFELIDDDEPVDAWVSARGETLLLVASTGHMIAFDPMSQKPVARGATPVLPRPSGLLPSASSAPGSPAPRRSERARGVRGMQLKDGATVVGGVVAKPGLEVALVTASGRARRISVDAFKPQARGGLGSPCTRLDDDERLVAAVSCHSSTDLVIFTDQGRDLRLPAPSVPLTDRLGEAGSAIVDLAPGEDVIGASRLLPLAYASDTPNAFEI